MTSPHVADKSVAYLTGALTDAERTTFDAHVASCVECREELEHVRVALSAVASWSREPALDAALEERLVQAVRNVRGAEPAAGNRWWKSGVAAAALVGVLAGALGFGAGRLTHTAGPSASSAPFAADSSLHSYLLLLEEPVWPPEQPLTRGGYGEWARMIAAESRFGGAEKLTEEPGFRVTTAGAARPVGSERSPNISGWYIVQARSYDEAIAWARRGPHLAYGSVLVREIENTPRTTR